MFNRLKLPIISFLFLFLSAVCFAQTEKISFNKASPFQFYNHSDTLANTKLLFEPVIKSSTLNYHPKADSTSYIECCFINRSNNSVLVDSTIFSKFRLFTCNHKWPLYMYNFKKSNHDDSIYTLGPNEEIMVFKATLKDICFSENYNWSWIGHPVPPSSPIYKSFSADYSFVDEICIFFAYKINGVLHTSNTLKIKVE
jgi:hypothetical protein